jgi:hypothetical protein
VFEVFPFSDEAGQGGNYYRIAAIFVGFEKGSKLADFLPSVVHI